MTAWQLDPAHSSIRFSTRHMMVSNVNLQGGLSTWFTASTRINRREWGLTLNVGLEAGGMLVGDEVKVEVDLELVQPAVPVEAEEKVAAGVA